MKTQILKLFASASLAVACLTQASAQNSPVGTWDFIISGQQRGIAYITFEEDSTFSGYEVLSVPPRKNSEEDPSNDQRNDGSSIGRVIIPPKTSNGTARTNFVGFAYISGRWTFDSSGRVVGVFTEGNDNIKSCTTNEVVVTTFETNIVNDIVIVSSSTTTNFVTSCETNGVTNAVNFVAVVKPGTRMLIRNNAGNGRTVLRGVPATEVPDISGSYLAVGRKNGVPFNELLSFFPSPEFANAFEVDVFGAGYEKRGLALLSSKNKLALVTVLVGDENADNELNALFGPINPFTGKAHVSGTDLKGVTTRLNISATK